MALGGVHEELRRGRFLKLLSITLPARILVDGEWIEPVGPRAYRYMAQRFNALMTTLRARYPMVYVRFVEEQKRGAPHYHLLVATRAFIPKRELYRLARQVGLGYTDIRRVSSPKDAAAYVMKTVGYVMKDAGGYVPKGQRFYTRSLAFAAETREDALADKAARCAGWSFAYVHERACERVLESLRAVGWPVEDPPEPPETGAMLAAVSMGWTVGGAC